MQKTIKSYQGTSFNTTNCASGDCEGHLRWLIETLSPVIFGKKPAEIISYPKHDCLRCEKLQEMEQRFDVSVSLKYRKIQQISGQIKVIFYHEAALKDVLEDKRVIKFMVGQGYPMHAGVNAWLDILSEKIEQGQCPDEIGIFLGYPLKDVIGYMGHPSLKLTKVQYWRVYGDSRLSDQRFQDIVDSRKRMQCMLRDQSLECVLEAI